jgi:hypothetical protein
MKPFGTNFAFALCLVSAIFASCENDFMKKAANTLSGPLPVIPAPINWSSNVVYVDPVGSGTMSGTITAVLNNGGRNIWFAKNQQNKPAKQWEFTVGPNNDGITPQNLIESLALAGSVPVTSNGDIMTLDFFNAEFPSISDSLTCSFILYPEALYGSDRDSIAIETATLNFRVEKPSLTSYAKYIIDKYEYGTIAVSWMEGSQSLAEAAAADFGDDEIRAEMQRIAGSYAAGLAGTVAEVWYGNTFNSDFLSSGSLAVVSWVSPPNLNKGWLPCVKYALELSSIVNSKEPTASPVTPAISVPIAFESYVGSASLLVKEAEEAGSFASLTTAADDTGYPAGSIGNVINTLGISGLLSGFTNDNVIITSGTLSGGTVTFSVAFPGGLDTSPAGTLADITAIFVDAVTL